MAIKLYNPASVIAPASNYSQCALVPAASERLIISGQIGVDPNGVVATGMEAQMRQTWANIFAALSDANMTKANLVKVTAFITLADAVGLYRSVRDELLDGHAPASTLLVITALATSELLVEIEAEAVR